MSPRHLLSAADLTREEATAILDDADRFSEALKPLRQRDSGAHHER